MLKTQLHQRRNNEATDGAAGIGIAITAAHEERSPVRSPQYSSFNVRLSTFARFPVIIGLDVHDIAAAGFYYTGDDDLVRCHACDGGLKQWVGDDDPWDEHYRWFPYCSYLTCSNYAMPKKIRSESRYMESAEKSSEPSPEAPQVVSKKLNILIQKPKEFVSDLDLNTPAALAALDFGYSITGVKMAIQELKSKGLTKLTANRILQVLLAFEDNGIKLPTKDDNELKTN